MNNTKLNFFLSLQIFLNKRKIIIGKLESFFVFLLQCHLPFSFHYPEFCILVLFQSVFIQLYHKYIHMCVYINGIMPCIKLYNLFSFISTITSILKLFSKYQKQKIFQHLLISYTIQMLICHPFLSLVYILVGPIKFHNCGKFFFILFFHIGHEYTEN